MSLFLRLCDPDFDDEAEDLASPTTTEGGSSSTRSATTRETTSTLGMIWDERLGLRPPTFSKLCLGPKCGIGDTYGQKEAARPNQEATD